MNHTIRERNVLRLVHDRADVLGNLYERIEQDEQLRNVRLNARHEPIPTRLYVLVFACLLATVISMVLP